VVFVRESARAIRDAAGKTVHYEGVVEDITERRQAEARNREQAELLDNATDAIYVTALDCTILYWNRGAERTYGWTRAEALNRKTTELLAADSAAAAALTAVLLKQETWSGERWQITKGGRKVEVLTRLKLVRNEQGQPQSVFAINTDITEKKKLEDQFLRAQRLESIGVLASGIAHDLNNVLAPIIMGAPLLRDKVKDEASSDLLKTIESSARRGAAVVKQVLTFARGVEGERVPLQPRHLIQEVVRLAEETFSKTIRIESDVPADLWPVLGDATQLHQALLNLCVNARDAMPGGGVLTMEAANAVLSREAAEKIPGAQPGSYACLRITDTGTGIPPEIEAKMFEPFFTTKSLGKGTGLGLSTVLGVVRSHGGFVRVASKVGQGTTFELYLPAAAAEQGTRKSESAAPWPSGHGEGVLVVDDEAAVREVARRTLAKFGYRVITAAHGAEALRIFQERRQEIQAVLTDMMMPEMDGAALIAALRVTDPAVRIIGVTGMSDVESMRGFRSLGLSGMLAKPFTIETLLAAVQAALPVTTGKEESAPAGGRSGPVPPG
jgi:two-component system, cell cycle sensor histidine kinase and response regulator CckA